MQAYTVEQVAKMLNISRDKVYYLLRTRQLQSIKIGKSRRITETRSRLHSLTRRQRCGMTSEERSELVGSHADTVQDLAQGAFGHVLTSVNRHGNRTAVEMAHEVVAALDARDGEAGPLQRLNDL